MTTTKVERTDRMPLLKRFGKMAYRLLETMTESAYRGFQSRMPYAYI
ncbi:hypothetical protein [Halomonas elongata]|uniref:Uncharacterized protein n=1 Tax=Halomonas elongata (strain ATCC 33173 / DSM 2581 / NBRC 15536 / NCIMB 2198 / 1H9) TaxID=768066 RepID=E1VC99_HALED|nr:hypothetical protein [Halomonas elongata]WBF18035.1 hypothetical protein LM502_18545 [Halomonas elongata]WPU46885.1 hypothetical protein SR933_16790 [Halomonas elongata DSM 2581]CBV44269.1 uncharacterized protein HELO_4385 [Halomonas elongata DSM 2581]